MNTSWTALRSDLDRIAGDAATKIKQARRTRALRESVGPALMMLVAFPATYLFGLGLAVATGASVPTMPWWAIVFVTLLIPLIYVTIRFFVAGAGGVTYREALATVDEHHGFDDRLQTAHEFAARSDRSSFMEAALHDAKGVVPTAVERGITPEVPGIEVGAVARFAAVAGLLLLAVALWVKAPMSVRSPSGPGGVPQLASAEVDVDEERESPNRPDVETPAKEDLAPARTARAGRRAEARPGRARTDISDDVKKTQGLTGTGQASEAASASGASEAKGTPSSQGQSGKPNSKKAKKKKKKKPSGKKPEEQRDHKPEKPERDAGATAGRGAASGSNKSPASSEWTSKDQVVSDDEEALEDDEPVDDEFDLEDARGGLQPSLRDRRPPVNRDLSIGFGNQKNPDANGRGGASEQKKSRGVASLVLGVPIPDHIKGRPNPGKTKITQERIEPRPETTGTVEASARKRRERPIGHLQRTELTPWMQDLLRSYYRRIRPAPKPVTP